MDEFTIEFPHNEESLLRNLTNQSNFNILNISNCPSTSEASKLISQLWFRENLNEIQRLQAVILKINEPLNVKYAEKPKFSEFDKENSILISFESIVDDKSLIYWKNQGCDKFLTLELLENSSQALKTFVINFLIESLNFGHSGILRQFNRLDLTKFSLNILLLGDSQGYNLLMIAALRGNIEILCELLKYSFDVNFEANQQTAINLAWTNHHFDAVFHLLKANSLFPRNFDKNLVERNIKKFLSTCENMHKAIRREDLGKITEILNENPHLRHFYNRNNVSAAFTACDEESIDIYTFLIANNVCIGPKENVDDVFRFLEEETQDNIRELHGKYAKDLPTKHLMVLIANSQVGYDDTNKNERLIAVKDAFDILNQIPLIHLILRVVAASKNFRIFFDFLRDSVQNLDPSADPFTNGNFYFSGQIHVAAKDLLDPENKFNAIGVLAHELCHMAMHLIFRNSARPYPLCDDILMREFERISQKCRDKMELENLVRLVYDCYNEKSWHAELIVRIPHMMAQYQNNQLKLQENRENFSELFEFFEIIIVPILENSIKVLEKIADKSNQISYRELSLSLRAKVSNSEVNFQGQKVNFNEILSQDSEAFNFLTSSQIHDILNEVSVEISTEQNLQLDFYIERKFIKRIINEDDINNEKTFDEICISIKESLKSSKASMNVKSGKNLPNISSITSSKISSNYSESKSFESNISTEISNNATSCNEASMKSTLSTESEELSIKSSNTKNSIEISKIVANFFKERLNLSKDSNASTETSILDSKIDSSNENSANSAIFTKILSDFFGSKSKTLTESSLDARNSTENSRNSKTPTESSRNSKTSTEISNISSKSSLNAKTLLETVKDLAKDLKIPVNYFGESSKVSTSTFQDSRVIILSDEAGAGKTTTFNYFAMKLKENFKSFWVSYIDLKKYLNIYDKYQLETQINQELVLEILMEILEIKKDSFEAKLFMNSMELGTVILLWDGVDEISPTFNFFILKFMSEIMKSTKIHQWISTRPQHAEKLEVTLNQAAFNFVPYTNFDQRDFIENYLRFKESAKVKLQRLNQKTKLSTENVKVSTDDIKTRVNNLINRIQDRTDDVRTVKNPIMLRIFIEICINNSSECENLTNIYSVYEFYFKKQISLLKDKGEIVNEDKDKVHGSIFTLRELHQFYAWKFLYPKLFDDKVDTKNLENFESAMNITGYSLMLMQKVINSKTSMNHELSRYGIIQFFTDNDFTFIHRTFAEFFLAQYAIDNLYELEVLPHTEELETRLMLLLYCITDSDVVCDFIFDYIRNSPGDREMPKEIFELMVKISDGRFYALWNWLKSINKIIAFLNGMKKFFRNDKKFLRYLWQIDENDTIVTFLMEDPVFMENHHDELVKAAEKVFPDEMEKLFAGKFQKGNYFYALWKGLRESENFPTVKFIDSTKIELPFSVNDLIEVENVETFLDFIKPHLSDDEFYEMIRKRFSSIICDFPRTGCTFEFLKKFTALTEGHFSREEMKKVLFPYDLSKSDMFKWIQMESTSSELKFFLLLLYLRYYSLNEIFKFPLVKRFFNSLPDNVRNLLTICVASTGFNA